MSLILNGIDNRFDTGKPSLWFFGFFLFLNLSVDKTFEQHRLISQYSPGGKSACFEPVRCVRSRPFSLDRNCVFREWGKKKNHNVITLADTWNLKCHENITENATYILFSRNNEYLWDTILFVMLNR